MPAATLPPAPLRRSSKNPFHSSGPGVKCTSASIRRRRCRRDSHANMEHRACGAEATLELRKTFRLLEGFKNRMSKTLSEMSKEELIALFESLTIKKASLEARRAELEHQLKLKNSNTSKSPSG
jgi:hypothetical protein